LDEGHSAITSADDRSNFPVWREREIVGTTDPSSIGHYASHGCIRLFIPDVKELYDFVPDGDARPDLRRPPWCIPTTFGIPG
jgi:L,D-transpeptidase catalytic domain